MMFTNEMGRNSCRLAIARAMRSIFQTNRTYVLAEGAPHFRVQKRLGHRAKSVSRTYGAPIVRDMAEALKKFPRYELNTAAEQGPKDRDAAA